MYSVAPPAPSITRNESAGLAQMCVSLSLRSSWSTDYIFPFGRWCRLQKISARLESIESVLQLNQRGSTDRDPSDDLNTVDQRQNKRRRSDNELVKQEEREESDELEDDRFPLDRPRVSNNLITEVTEIMQVGYAGGVEAGSRIGSEVDVISRGLLSLEDAQTLFDLYVLLLPRLGCHSEEL